MDEGTPDLRAALDQAGAAMKDVAVLLAGYYRALVDQGMPHDTASALVVDYQDQLTGLNGGES